MNIRHDCIISFTKHANLSSYFWANESACCKEYGVDPSKGITEDYERRAEKMIAYYNQPRDIQLILLVRYENGKTFCRIKCPINPLPIKGEFEAPNLKAVIKFLQQDGWKEKHSLPTYLLK
jgi:hypothetical protein